MDPVEIPDGLKDLNKYFDKVREYLGQISGELQSKLRSKEGTIRVTSRLNASGTHKAVPVWVGTYETGEVRTARRFDPGQVRFGQSNRSKVYEETVNDKKGNIHYRDWRTSLPEKTENGYGPGQAYGPREGFMYQFFVAIRKDLGEGKCQHVGTITVGFRNKPDRKRVEEVMKRWARDSNYVTYLEKTFNLGGPVF